MKNNAFKVLMFIIIYFSVYSQKVYSQQNSKINSQDNITLKKYTLENLQQATVNDLSLYLKKSKGRKTTGQVMTFTSPVLMFTGLVMAIGWKDGSVPVALTGLASSAIGVPLWVSGSKRSKKIKQEFRKRPGVSYKVGPGLFYTNINKNPSPGINFKLGF